VKRVLITGVAGFMGSHLADRFLKDGYEVIGIDNLLGGYLSNIPIGVTFVNADLGNFEQINQYFKNIDLVVHTACTAYEGLSVFSPSLVTRNTSHITTVAISSSIKHGVKKFIHMSSMARYGTQATVPFTEDMTPRPQDPYGISKYASELLLRNLAETHGMNYVILVPHNIIGPRQKYDDPYRNVASIMINRMLQNKQPIIYGDGLQMRCFSFMQDVIDPLMVACESNKANGKVINIGPDEESISILGLASKLANILHFELDPIFMPGRPQEVTNANCSANLARKILDYRTKMTLDNGLTELVTWIKEQGTKDFKYHLPLEFITDKTPKTWSEKLM
jgi:UDP-glucose 4-epimerase